MSTATTQLRNITASQWKAVMQLKNAFLRAVGERSAAAGLGKEWVDIFKQIPLYMKQTNEKTYGSERDGRAQENTKGGGESSTELIVSEPKPDRVQTKKPVSKDLQATVWLDDLILDIDEGRIRPYILTEALVNKLQFHTSKTKRVEKFGMQDMPPWIQNVEDLISYGCLENRTKHVIDAISSATTVRSRVERLKYLTEHLRTHPQTKAMAIKEGAVRLLLHIRTKTEDDSALGYIRESLIHLGYIDPLRGRGIRILSVDGGGTRAVLVIQMLKKIEEITGQRVYELFDYMCGVSTGAILTMMIGARKYDLQESLRLYKEISSQIFTQSAIKGTGNLMWSHSYYDSALWTDLLKKFIGEEPMMDTARDPECPKLAAMSAVVNDSGVRPFVFRNYSFPKRSRSHYEGSSKNQLWEAVRASSNAPTFFVDYKIGDVHHQDGGILINNPCALAIHETKQLWPNESLQCVVSCGTGRTVHPLKYLPQNPAPLNDSKSLSWKEKFMKILDSATDTENVHIALHDMLPSNQYFRLNPHIDEMVSMDEIRPEKMKQLEDEAQFYIEAHEDKFLRIGEALKRPRTNAQKAHDWLELQKCSWGVRE